MGHTYLGWASIVRLGLVQAAIGAIVVLTTSTLNRVMVVELGLAAIIPGALVGWHYVVQLSRPRWGHGSDQGGRRTPWIIAGMTVLALGGVLAADAAALAAQHRWAGVGLSVVAFTLIGLGVGAAGTSLLALLATGVAPRRRAAAASLTWIMMILGFVITAAIAGANLDPFSYGRLVAVTTIICGVALIVTLLAVAGVERRIMTAPHGAALGAAQTDAPAAEPTPTPFREALADVLREPQTRRFTLFVFVAMLAYSMQDLILEPFAGLVFAYTPGASTSLASVQHGGVLIGMVGVALLGSVFAGGRWGSRQMWTMGGCFLSAIALGLLSMASLIGGDWPLRANVFLLGLANGAFAVAAIGAMLGLAGEGKARREGMRMGVWGASQALAFALGGFLGAAGVDVARAILGETQPAFAWVFGLEALLFFVAGALAAGIGAAARPTTPSLADPQLLGAAEKGAS